MLRGSTQAMAGSQHGSLQGQAQGWPWLGGLKLGAVSPAPGITGAMVRGSTGPWCQPGVLYTPGDKNRAAPIGAQTPHAPFPPATTGCEVAGASGVHRESVWGMETALASCKSSSLSFAEDFLLLFCF